MRNFPFSGADDGVHGTKLWCSDGTAAGTFEMSGISPSYIKTVGNAVNIYDSSNLYIY